MFRFFMVLAVSVATTFAAHAVSLVNKDSTRYDIKVRGTSTMSTYIGGKTTKGSICSSSCKIEVSGVGEIEASGSDKVIIKNGKLEKK